MALAERGYLVENLFRISKVFELQPKPSNNRATRPMMREGKKQPL